MVSAVPFFVFQRGLNAAGAEGARPSAPVKHAGRRKRASLRQAADGKKRKKRRARWKILSEVEVEVLQLSLSDSFRMTSFSILLGWRVMGREC